jgi:hypothetical protein
MHALEQNVRSVNTMVRKTDLDRCFAHGRLTWAEDCLDNALALISTISTNNSDWYGRNGSRPNSTR